MLNVELHCIKATWQGTNKENTNCILTNDYIAFPAVGTLETTFRVANSNGNTTQRKNWLMVTQ